MTQAEQLGSAPRASARIDAATILRHRREAERLRSAVVGQSLAAVGSGLLGLVRLATDPVAAVSLWRRHRAEREGWRRRFERTRRELASYTAEELRLDLGIFPSEIDRVAAQTASMRA